MHLSCEFLINYVATVFALILLCCMNINAIVDINSSCFGEEILKVSCKYKYFNIFILILCCYYIDLIKKIFANVI